ncbi:MAG TPA: PAS domain S-box protein, partial [Candidatus Goldiibacteriota bacterium]|nr:PAS domain S-box protein [Candidatus Goldiibacteriota bacterium]
SSRDISERKRMIDNLARLSTVVEQSPVSIVITNLAGDIEYVNPKFTEVTGYTREEAIGQNPRVLKSGDKDSDEYRALWEDILAGKEWRGEFCNKKKNGDIYWESALISPSRDSSNTITHFLAIKEDITASRQTEIALRESETRLRSITDAARDAILMMTPDGNISIPEKPLIYPNPVNGDDTVKIRFLITKQAKVIKIKIYTVSARLVKYAEINTSDRNLMQGYNVIELPDNLLRQLARGTYYYSISAEDAEGNKARAKTDKIIIMK